MARIVVLGAGGRLGAALAREYAADHDVLAWGRKEADLSDPERVAAQVREAKPDIVINCAAMTNVDECETEREKARVINADAAGAMARACEEIGAKMIHISTDYVFSGEKTEPYAEDDQAEPVSWYGETKLAGEDAALAAGTRHAVVRVSWVFGPDRDSFVDKALQTAMRGELVKAVADKWSSPAYTLDIAEALRSLMGSDAPGGIYHVCNTGTCTWQDWGAEAIRVAEVAGLIPTGTKVKPLCLSDIKAMVARRPVHSAMTCQRIEKLIRKPIRPWQEAVADYVRTRYAKGGPETL
ncbi:MAG: dTDP-4-dehydrorhamnose reductase [Chthoniobacterales bacterium]